ncbi:DUF3775 domain-containing protein [Nostoc sp. XA013]|nr:DUF3775 domain-containing protein [Nostoc sp. XA013]
MKILPTEKVNKVIELADAVAKLARNYEESSAIPGLKDSEDIAHSVMQHLEDLANPDNPKYELREYIDKLSNDEINELTALMWLGRGASNEKAKDFPNLVNEAKKQKIETSYIAGKVPLAQYLRAGLKKMNLSS